ncbi:hypothetical protein K0U07_00645 [bacterium]|nr:hypothetical protein [bacterium]
MKQAILLILTPFFLFAKPKALHLTFHKGTEMEMKYLCKELGIELTTWNILGDVPFEIQQKNRHKFGYIISHDLAERTFNTYKEEFDQYDLIITSDIAPLARIFLQNNWKKPLLIWVCNRFDLNARCSGIKVFPDREFLKLFSEAKDLPNVEVIGWSRYEDFHARAHRNISTISQTIEPTGNGEPAKGYRHVPKRVNKSQKVFVRNYRNEKKFRLRRLLANQGINVYQGPFAGGKDIKDFIGMVHIPLVMGNMLLWENLSHGVVHFLPSKRLYKEWYDQGKIEFWDWTSPYRRMSKISAEEIFTYSDWYHPKLAHLFIYFDCLEELNDLIKETDYAEKKALIKEFHEQHTKECLKKWKIVFDRLLP